MGSKTWTFKLEDGEHTVQFEHGYWSGNRTIVLDGRPIVQEVRIMDLGSDHLFEIGGHQGLVTIRTNGFAYKYDLAIDGKSVTTGQPVLPAAPMPIWGWIFVVACAIIPIVALCGAIPILIGGVGAMYCYIIARDAAKEEGTRLVICAGITLLCWATFAGVIWITIGLRTAS